MQQMNGEGWCTVKDSLTHHSRLSRPGICLLFCCSLEIVTNNMSTIIPETEKYIASLNLPQKTTAKLHQDLINNCKPQATTPRPELAKNLEKVTNPRKRKPVSSTQLPPVKKPKTTENQPFLVLGPQTNTALT